jgi:hypothetical protein
MSIITELMFYVYCIKGSIVYEIYQIGWFKWILVQYTLTVRCYKLQVVGRCKIISMIFLIVWLDASYYILGMGKYMIIWGKNEKGGKLV